LKAGHIPIRMCVVCRKKKPKDELLRFRADGVAPGGSPAEGRGMYLCREAACMETALKRADIRKRLGPLAHAKVLEGLEAVTTMENCLDGSSLGSVICDECHGGGAIG